MSNNQIASKNNENNIKIKLTPDLCVNSDVYVYYVYDSKKYTDIQVTKDLALAKIFVQITPRNQHINSIEIIDKNIELSEIIELAKKYIFNVSGV